jgi:thioredoxin-related protein
MTKKRLCFNPGKTVVMIRKSWMLLSFILMLGVSAHTQPNSLLKKTGTTPRQFTSKSGTMRSQNNTNNSIKWLTWEEVQEYNKKEKRKILLDVYTDWCGWCKKMDSETFSHPQLAKYLNDNYYMVKLNAEQKEVLMYKDKEYRFVKTNRGGYHELAEEFLQGRMSYPSLVFLDENMNLIQPIPGYRQADDLMMISSYIGSDSYREMPWGAYQREFKFPDNWSNK